LNAHGRHLFSFDRIPWSFSIRLDIRNTCTTDTPRRERPPPESTGVSRSRLSWARRPPARLDHHEPSAHCGHVVKRFRPSIERYTAAKSLRMPSLRMSPPPDDPNLDDSPTPTRARRAHEGFAALECSLREEWLQNHPEAWRAYLRRADEDAELDHGAQAQIHAAALRGDDALCERPVRDRSDREMQRETLCPPSPSIPTCS